MNNFESILYKKDEPVKVEDSTISLTLPAFVMVPHAKLDLIENQISKALSLVKNTKPKQIVFLAPMHRPFLDEDANLCCITNKEGVREEWLIKEREYYFKEEFSFEIMGPTLRALFADTPMIPLLAEKATEELRILVKKIISDNKDTLFIVSNNIKVQTETKDEQQIMCYDDRGCAHMWLWALDLKWTYIDRSKHPAAYVKESDNVYK